MFYVNEVTLLGNVARPEMRYTPSGVAVLKFGLATTRGIKKNDEWQDVTTWHNVVVFGKTAERLASIVTNGVSVYVKGRIDNREYEKDGVKKYISEVIAENIIVPNIRKAKTEGQPEQAPVQTPVQEVKETRAPAPDEEINIEDIPF